METYGQDVQFFIVYIREAHPIDGQAPSDFKSIEDPITDKERMKVAGACVEGLGFEKFPTLVDRMDDAVGTAYAAIPDRLYLVGKDGNVAYAGNRGPRGFSPDELEAAIKRELSEAKKKKPDSEKTTTGEKVTPRKKL